MLEVPYRFGGTTLWGLDCSGFVQKAFAFLNLDLPRSAREQFREGAKVAKADLSPGDLVFFRTYAKYPSHVGIYLGDNRFVHASSRERKVTVDSLDTPYYVKRYVGAKRLLFEEDGSLPEAQ
jgi:cell wall-associated NlpC family hydrolase